MGGQLLYQIRQRANPPFIPPRGEWAEGRRNAKIPQLIQAAPSAPSAPSALPVPPSPRPLSLGIQPERRVSWE